MSQTLATIMGAHFRPPAKAILSVLPTDCPLSIVPEPTNEYDPNALQVVLASADIPEDCYNELDLAAAGYGFSVEQILAQEQWQLGYVGREYAANLAPFQAKIKGGAFRLGADGKWLVRITLED